MKVFISYGDRDDQVIALRLQALAVVDGMTVYVPPAFTRQTGESVLNSTSGRNLKRAEIVLGVVATGMSEACRQELNAALALKKHMIVMASPAIAGQLRPYFGPNLVTIDLENPVRSETEIVKHLTAVEAQQNSRTALLALGTLALGLLMMAPADRS